MADERKPDIIAPIRIVKSTSSEANFDWTATSKTHPNLKGYGDTAEEALDEIYMEIVESYPKRDYSRSCITGVSAEVKIYMPRDRTLAEFSEAPSTEESGEE